MDKEFCKKCEYYNEEYAEDVGCIKWHNDRKFGGCTEFFPNEKKTYQGMPSDIVNGNCVLD